MGSIGGFLAIVEHISISFLFRSIARPLGILCGIKDTSSELENVFQLVYRKLFSSRPAPEHQYFNKTKMNVTNGTIAYEQNGYIPSSEDENVHNSQSEENAETTRKKRTKSESKRRLIVPKSTLDKFSESW